MLQQISEKRKEINELCLKHNVLKMYVFGSATTDRFNESSDIDLLITFGDVPLLEFADNYFDLKTELETLFGTEVDLVIEKDLTNIYLIQSINRSKVLLYERRTEEMAA